MFIGYYSPLFYSAISPWTTLGPLAFVVLVSLAQEAYTDARRHRSDKATLVTVAHPSGDTSLPKHTIPVTGFTHLWHRFTSLHPDLTPSRFHSELYDLLSRESEGSKRTTGIDVNFRNFWCTPPALLRILRDLFSLHSERFCNPLNFSPLFQKATTANAEDKFWGFDFDAMLRAVADRAGWRIP